MWGLWFAVASAAPVTVDEVVAAALAHDPALAGADAAVRAAEGALAANSGLRENPTLDARLGFGVPQHEFAVRQSLSLTGEGRRAAQAAEAALDAARADHDRRRLEVAAQVRRDLVGAIGAAGQLALARETLQLATALRAAAEARLSTGDAPELGVHLARLEEAAAVADVIAGTRSSRAAVEALVARTGLPFDAELPTDPLAAVPAEGSGTATRSDLRAAVAHADSAAAALERERASAFSPVELGAWVQLQGGGVGLTAGPTLGVSLPLWKRNPAGVAAALGALTAAEAEVAALQARSEAERFGAEARLEVVALASAVADPTTEARAVLAGIDLSVDAGQIGLADAAVLRSRVLEAWRRGATARSEAALAAIEAALAGEWPTLLGAE